MSLHEAALMVAARLVEIWVENYCPDCKYPSDEDILILEALKKGKYTGLESDITKAIKQVRRCRKQNQVIEDAMILLAA
jgi:hypothetical protein